MNEFPFKFSYQVFFQYLQQDMREGGGSSTQLECWQSLSMAAAAAAALLALEDEFSGAVFL